MLIIVLSIVVIIGFVYIIILLFRNIDEEMFPD